MREDRCKLRTITRGDFRWRWFLTWCALRSRHWGHSQPRHRHRGVLERAHHCLSLARRPFSFSRGRVYRGRRGKRWGRRKESGRSSVVPRRAAEPMPPGALRCKQKFQITRLVETLRNREKDICLFGRVVVNMVRVFGR